MCNRSCGAIFCALSTFPHLTKLFVLFAMSLNLDYAAPEASCALRVATQLPISNLTLCTLRVLNDLFALITAPDLCCLTATNCELRSLDDLKVPPGLHRLDASRTAALLSLTPLSASPCLETIIAYACGSDDLQTLGSCSQLKELNVSENRHF
jgi:hypothetical protein